MLGDLLRWRSLPPDPGQWCPPPRSRHSALCLRSLQLPAPSSSPSYSHTATGGTPLALGTSLRASLRLPTPGDTAGHRASVGSAVWAERQEEVEAVVPGVAGVVVVFGGVDGEVWLRDLHVLEVAYTGERAGGMNEG